jgi:hypothetical protein
MLRELTSRLVSLVDEQHEDAEEASVGSSRGATGIIAEPEVVNSIGWKERPDGDEERARAFAKRAPATRDEQEKLE